MGFPSHGHFDPAQLLHYLTAKRTIRFDRPEDQPMRKLMRDFWRDDRGYVPVMEWMLVASILTLGAIAVQMGMQTP